MEDGRSLADGHSDDVVLHVHPSRSEQDILTDRLSVGHIAANVLTHGRSRFVQECEDRALPTRGQDVLHAAHAGVR